MAVNTGTILRKHPDRAFVREVARVLRAAGARLVTWWTEMAARGQLGQDYERKIGRHTGARI